LSAVSYDRHCEEIGTYLESVAAALAPNVDNQNAPGIVRDALEQLSTDLFMLGAVLGDESAAAAAPIDPRILQRSVAGLRGRVEALQKFAEHKLGVRWRYDDDDVTDGAERDLATLQRAAEQRGGAT
jgi:hypothetical protein